MGTQNGCSLAAFLIEIESRNTSVNSKQNMAVMTSAMMAPHPIALPCALAFPTPNR